MNMENNTENANSRTQFILDENGELQEISKDKCKTVEFPIKYKLKNAYEVFVRVEGTENYWISNYGRCVNNLNRKDKDKFYEHKQGKCHTGTVPCRCLYGYASEEEKSTFSSQIESPSKRSPRFAY